VPVGRKRALAKPEEHVLLKKRTSRVPRIYIVNEPPVTIEVEGKTYECKNIVQAPSGLLCIQYDGTAVLLPQQPQQPQQEPTKPHIQLV